MRVVVIGAGFAGLSAACMLAKDGYDVTVIEKNDQSGGRGRKFSKEGFTFDMGPSWYLMHDVFERFFAQFEKKPSDYYTLTRLDPCYRLIFGKDDVIDITPDMEKTYALFDSLEEGGADKLRKLLAQSERQYDISMKNFLYKEYRSPFDLFNLTSLREGSRLNVFQNMQSYMDSIFTSDRAKKILLYTMVFLGGNPKNTPAIYNVMAHVDFNMGVWYPQGGMNAVAQGMERLARELGVEFRYSTPATGIDVHHGRAVAVHTPHGDLPADHIIVNADYHHAETALIPEKYRRYDEKKWEKMTIAPSGLIIYLGIKRRIPSLTHHNLFLENDWMQHFDELFDTPRWAQRPSYYVCAPSKTDPNVAPKGCENLFILVPLAAGLDDTGREAYAEKILAHLESITEPFRDDIVVKELYSHRDFTADYNAYKGTALGLTQTLMQTAFFRPKMQSRIPNVRYTGQFTVPGTGVPIAVISGEIAARGVR